MNPTFAYPAIQALLAGAWVLTHRQREFELRVTFSEVSIQDDQLRLDARHDGYTTGFAEFVRSAVGKPLSTAMAGAWSFVRLDSGGTPMFAMEVSIERIDETAGGWVNITCQQAGKLISFPGLIWQFMVDSMAEAELPGVVLPITRTTLATNELAFSGRHVLVHTSKRWIDNPAHEVTGFGDFYRLAGGILRLKLCNQIRIQDDGNGAWYIVITHYGGTPELWVRPAWHPQLHNPVELLATRT